MHERTATVTFSEDVRGGTETAGTSIALRVDEPGFHAAGGLGRSGLSVEPPDVAAVAELPRSQFDTKALWAVLAQLRRFDAAPHGLRCAGSSHVNCGERRRL
jgi:hypothetical protein